MLMWVKRLVKELAHGRCPVSVGRYQRELQSVQTSYQTHACGLRSRRSCWSQPELILCSHKGTFHPRLGHVPPEGALNAVVPKTKRKFGELFLGCARSPGHGRVASSSARLWAPGTCAGTAGWRGRASTGHLLGCG